MNIQELIQNLQDIAEFYPDAEVQMATQPGYPIAETIGRVVSPDDESEDMDDDEIEELTKTAMGSPAKVWLVSGGQDDKEPYAPRWVFNR